MAINLSDLRVRIDQTTEKIISALKDRSRYKLNRGVFTEEFSDGKTWFEYRLKKEQDLDSEFGRYEFPDQYPLMFTKEELAQPKKKRIILQSDVKSLSIDVGEKIIEFYKKMLPELCDEGENRANYGETVKCDVNNVMLYNERINGIGRFVAEAKLQKKPSIATLTSIDDIGKILVVPKREEEVIEEAVKIARKYELHRPEFIKKFFRQIIDLTLYAEMEYVKKAR
jgi:chorismate mutase